MLNDAGNVEAFRELIPSLAKPDIQRLDAVLVYVERRGRSKSDSPWSGPYLVEEILDERTLKLSDGNEVDVSNIRKLSHIENPIVRLDSEKLSDWAEESKLELSELEDVFGAQGTPLSKFSGNPWKETWLDKTIYISTNWRDLNDVYLKMLHEVPYIVLLLQPKMVDEEFYKISKHLHCLRTTLDENWLSKEKLAYPMELLLFNGAELTRQLRNAGGVTNLLGMLR
jgi:hypothetical protein